MAIFSIDGMDDPTSFAAIRSEADAIKAAIGSGLNADLVARIQQFQRVVGTASGAAAAALAAENTTGGLADLVEAAAHGA